MRSTRWMNCQEDTKPITWSGLTDDLATNLRSRICDRQIKPEQAHTGTPETFLLGYLISRGASEEDWRMLILDISEAVMHARTDEIYVNMTRDIRPRKFHRFKSGVSGTRKASQQFKRLLTRKTWGKFMTTDQAGIHFHTKTITGIWFASSTEMSLIARESSYLRKSENSSTKDFWWKLQWRPHWRMDAWSHFLKKTITDDESGLHLELDEVSAKSVQE